MRGRRRRGAPNNEPIPIGRSRLNPSITSASGIPVNVFASPDVAGSYAADEVLMRLELGRHTRGHMTLGCPGGRSLRTTYAALARLAAVRSTDLRDLHILMMDEYVLRDGSRWALCPADAHYSCLRFGEVEIRQVLNAGLPAGSHIPARNVHVPDPNAPDTYEALIERLGGIDLFLLASGATDGHVAFNPRGCAADARTRVVELSDDTRRDNLGTFPQFGEISQGAPLWRERRSGYHRAPFAVGVDDAARRGEGDCAAADRHRHRLRRGLARDRGDRLRRCTDRRRHRRRTRSCRDDPQRCVSSALRSSAESRPDSLVLSAAICVVRAH